MYKEHMYKKNGIQRILKRIFPVFFNKDHRDLDEESEDTPITVTPERRRESVSAPTGRLFSEYELHEQLMNGIRNAGFERCTPIQERCLPLSLTGRDIAGQAQTGTGKTAAFLVTVLNRLLSLEQRDPAYPSALIVAPTRELALQIYDDAQMLGGETDFAITAVFGGVNYEKQARQLKEGTDIVIGTPGRIIDYMKQKILRTSRVRMLVIDEADKMFDMGFIKDLRFILRRLPPYDKRQSMLFSATLNYRVLELAYEHMNCPEEIYIEPQERTVDTVEQSVYHVGSKEKLSLLLGLLKRETWHRVLIFCNTKAHVEFLAEKLKGNGHPAEGITGDLPQQKRLRLMEKFKSGELKIVVATDVASRGIHVEDISHVINYDVPQDREDYVHRIGRTARAGKKGNAILLACEKWVLNLASIEEYLGQKIPVCWYEESWLEEDKAPKWFRKRRSAPGRRGTDSGDRTRTGGRFRTGGGSRRRPSDRRPKASDSSTPKESSGAGSKASAERGDEEPKKARRPRRRRKPSDSTTDGGPESNIRS